MYALFVALGTANPSQSVANFGVVDGQTRWAATNENTVAAVIPHALTLDQLEIGVANAPGVGKSIKYEICQNGSPTSLAVTMSGAETFDSDKTHSVHFAAGDTISIKATPTGNPTLPGGISITVRQLADTSGIFAILFNSGTQISATTFISPCGGQVSGTENQIYAPFPMQCQLKNLYVRAEVDPTTGGASWAVAARVAGTDQSLSATISAGSTTGNDTNAGHTVSVNAGDVFSIHATATGSPSASRLSGGVTVQPSTDGDACWFCSHSNTDAGTQVQFGRIQGSYTSYITTEALGSPRLVAPDLILKSIYVRLSAAPGASPKQWTVAVANGGTATAVSCTITGAAVTTGSITGQSVNVTELDQIDVIITPSTTPNAPTAARLQTGICYTMTPPPTPVSSADTGAGSDVGTLGVQLTSAD